MTARSAHLDAWQNAERVLCVRLDALGDVLMTSPALRALKRANPLRKLTLLTSPAGAAIARFLPGVDTIIVYEAPWMKAVAARTNARLDYTMLRRLREDGFDAAVIFTVYSQSPLPAALACYLAEIPLRLAHCRENPYHLLTDWVREIEPEEHLRHEVRRQLDLVQYVGALPDGEQMRLQVPPQHFMQARRHLAALGIDPETPWILIHPGANAPSRRYNPSGFAAAARALVQEHGYAVIYTGSMEEVALIERIRSEMGAPSHSLAGKVDLGTLCALIALAPVVVSNNTGPAHVAAAMGTPVVDLYALTNPQHMPWGVDNRVLYHDVSCKFCYKSECPAGHHDCLQRVSPQSVVEAVLELFAARTPTQQIAQAGD